MPATVSLEYAPKIFRAEDSVDTIADGEFDALENLSLALARQQYAERGGHGFHRFIQDAWKHVPTIEGVSGDFIDNWHIRELCRELDALLPRPNGMGQGARVIINIPPGAMKSLLVSVFFPAWAWTLNPKLQWLTVSYSDKLTTRDNLRVRQIVQSTWFQTLWPIRFAEDQDTKTKFNTEAGGWRYATSVDGGGTGEHPDFVIIDDASKATEAKSEAERQRINTWYSTTIPSRGRGKSASILVVGQRLHDEDLPGYLLAQGGWTHICWPMRYEKCTCTAEQRCALHLANEHWHPDPRDPRTEAGELLWPALFDEPKVEAMERELLEDAPGQLQQRPSREGGTLFKREWFKFVEALPARRISCRGWDTAATEENARQKGDRTAGIKMSEGLEVKRDPNRPRWPGAVVRTGIFFIEHAIAERLGPDGVDALMKSLATTDGKACAVREQREGGASGKAVITARARLLRGHDYEEVPVGVNKVLFSKPLRSQCAAGNVCILRTGDPARDAWIEPFLAELCAFPTGKHDDQVDGASTAFNSLGELPIPQGKGAIWGKG